MPLDTIAPDELDAEVQRTGQRYGVDPKLISSVITQESGGNPYAVSSAGAGGLMQLMPETAAGLGVKNLFDWRENLDAGTRYLKQGLDTYNGQPDLAAAYYHGGPNTNMWGPRTAQYADAVASRYRQLAGQRTEAPEAPAAQQQPAQPAQPSIADQIAAARKAGYSDDEIGAYLRQSQTWGPKFSDAAKAGYSDAEVFQHLGLAVRPVTPQRDTGIQIGLHPEEGRPLTSRQAVKQLPIAKTEAEAPLPPTQFVASQVAPQAEHPLPTEEEAATPTQQEKIDEIRERTGIASAQRIWQAVKQGWQASPELLTPSAQAFADKWGLGGDARAVSGIMAALNAGFSGTVQGAYEIARSVGGEQMARDVAGYVEAGGMTGAEPVRMPEAAAEPKAALGEIAAGQPGAAAATAMPALEQAAQAAERPMPTLERMAGEATRRNAAAVAPEVPRETPAEAFTPEQAAALEREEMAKAAAAGLKPIRDEQGNWIGYERKEPTLEAGVAQPAAPAETVPPEPSPAPSPAEAAAPPTEEPVAPTEIPEKPPISGKLPTPYVTIPREPTRLVDYLRRPTVQNAGTIHETTIPGGIKDAGGDLKAIIGGAKGRPGLINNRTGLSWDDAAVHAYEGGYFDHIPDINELQDAIRADHTGTPHYSIQDADRVADYQAARGQNAEVDRLAYEHGIDTRGLTHEQFFDHLYDTLSLEERAREIEDQHAAMLDAERGVERGSLTEGQDRAEYYGASQARTLEDLERERLAEEGAANAGQYARGTETPGLAGGAEAVGPEGVEPRGGDLGPTGRSEAEGAPTDLLGRPLAAPRERAQPEPTIRTDVPQQEPGGIFERPPEGQGTLYSFPGALFDPQAWRQAFGPLAPVAKATRDATRLVGESIQKGLMPISVGTTRAKAFAADFANSLRQVQYRYGQIDREIARTFTPNERDAMGRALDAQSVFEQQVRDLPAEQQAQARADFDANKTGLAGLEARQRQVLDMLDAMSQDVWRRMQDRGMVAPTAQGLPYYMPRQVLLWSEAEGFRRTQGAGGAGRGIEPRGLNLTTQGPMRREHLTPEETEAAARAKLGAEATLLRDIRSLPARLAYSERAMAGVDLMNAIEQVGKETGVDLVVRGDIPGLLQPGDFFTMADHPAFRRWAGAGWQAVHVAKEFEGPLKAVLTQPSPTWYRAAQSVKGGVMNSIMFSPFIHLAVELGRSLPVMPGKILTFQALRDGSRLRRNLDYMDQAVRDGMSPIGQGWHADPVTIADQANVEGRNAFIRALNGAREAVARGAGAIGGQTLADIMRAPHQTLLWDNVFNLQVGIYDTMRQRYIDKGFAPEVAGTMAAHIANRYAGALPPEHLSRSANMAGNLLLFSRSFTLGNLGVMKDMLTGMPSQVRARIEQMAGPEVAKSAQSAVRRKAIAAFTTDIGLFYLANGLLQAGIQVMRNMPEQGLPAAAQQTYQNWLDEAGSAIAGAKDNPLSLFGILPQHWNEPGKQDRVYAGTDAQGRSIYLRLPPGKVGEEFIGWFGKPGTMIENKLSPLARPIIESIFGKDTLGRDIYKPNPQTLGDHVAIAGAIAKHIGEGLGPTSTIQGVKELFQQYILGQKTQGDPYVSAAKVLGPLTGLAQVSQGYPGGPAAGEMHAESEREQYDLRQALPAIRDKIRSGDTEGAIGDLQALRVPPSQIEYYLRQTLRGAGLSPGAQQRLGTTAPEVRERVTRQLGQQP